MSPSTEEEQTLAQRGWKALLPDQLEELRFRWEVWHENAKAFWRRAIVASLLTSIFYLYESGVIKTDQYLRDGVNPLIARCFILLVCLFLLLFVVFGFIDLMRHRVPNEFEYVLHTNWIKLPLVGKINLRTLGQLLYYAVFALYLLIFGGGWIVVAIRLFRELVWGA